ncbi:hypothetical protein CC1G_09332 [Coprinopsis cinerea okayama7|uniref:Proteophosphoglycan ppg4 n=1 Tax=Coprinopsis cinerea (strain Okayama-7 / 130 / ATCC MYA-4618 / FGSC 9003) TaxID=240176 RepID=A8N5M7_COPC7|nr:hypothetical protein CC1G_09332 [Coprinopsis cinerea okayama7\|eukprot:XP_001830172.2 hypothetical protein CC1G_09332 [Coprinopsis cinerea okayama7\
MTTALPVLRNDAGPSVHPNIYPRNLLTEFDLKDNRYPSLTPKSRGNLGHNPASLSADLATMERRSNHDAQLARRSFDPQGVQGSPPRNAERPPSQGREGTASRRGAQTPETAKSQSQQPQDSSRSSLSYALPENVPRRVVERYSLDGNAPPAANDKSQTPTETGRQNGREFSVDTPTRSNTPQPAKPIVNAEIPATLFASTPRHPDVALASSASATTNGNQFPPIMPLSASPNYVPPVASRNRTYPQQPTYINPSNPPNPVDAVYTPMPPPQEEVCVECAMRDQDMADVDVTSPGVWDRTSDVLFEELKQREEEERAKGIVNPDPNRPRAVGGKLTEQNLKIWLSINPREPASRQQTLNTYVKSQRALLEAEALAHAQAMQEAKRLDSKMRDAYSQLRRSAYDLGNTPAPTDDSGGVRIKPPHSPTGQNYTQSHLRSQSREVTLLENGMIVEHVDVRREEKEAKERRRKEEKRARKSSRSSVMDATSVISGQSIGPYPDSSLKPHSGYSHSTSGRPNSVFTGSNDRPDLPRAYSQASFSDVHSLNSSSPKRKFFGVRNLSTGWRSQDSLAPSFAPSGMSGSMVDMHVALQREDRRKTLLSPNDANTSRRSTLWHSDLPADISATAAEEKAKKKKSGLIKWWRMVTGHNKPDTLQVRDSSLEKDDDLPLAPPPPLSYLVGRSSPDHISPRHANSIPPPLGSPMFGQSGSSVSPPTAPSSALPSPTSTRPLNGDPDVTLAGDDSGSNKNKSNEWRLHPVSSEPNLRQSAVNQEPIPPVPSLPNGGNQRVSMAISREKSLPPIPTDEAPAFATPADRPRTVYTYDPRPLPPGTRPPHDFLPPSAPFQSDSRRQSFSGVTSKPNLLIQTMPVTQFDPRQSRYDEFGDSRKSLARLDWDSDDTQGRRALSPLPNSTTKRKSKFGFSSLLGGKKSKEQEGYSDYAAQPFPTLGGGRYDDGSAPGSFENQRTNRTSILSRKPLNELVSQDPEFVAYRYPSTEQRLDLLR